MLRPSFLNAAVAATVALITVHRDLPLEIFRAGATDCANANGTLFRF